MMLYQMYDLQRLAMQPMRAMVSGALSLMEDNPLRETPFGRVTAAALDSFEHTTRTFVKPAFGHTMTVIDGEPVDITEEISLRLPWCDLLHFKRAVSRPNDPTLLIVAPMSGHFATLLRGTVQAFLPDHEVYITDWQDAKDMPMSSPVFDLDDYIDYVQQFCEHLGPKTHMIAVCQPAVPVLASTALMNAEGNALTPASITLIGGPIDTREAPTEVNNFAKKHDLEWFKNNVIQMVPWGNAGFMRTVYPGFVQLAGFMAMNLGRHMEAHWQMFTHLVDGDGEPLASKRAFYDEYRSVMDLSSEFYLQTINAVFHEHLLPRGLLVSRNRLVDPAAITRTAIMTVEGEKDDISGIGQTRVTHALTPNLPEHMHEHWEQPKVGHYGLFNGARFRNEIAPRIKTFIAKHN
ncbi:polyhydroxyalkanoate depolymerase [Acidisphaera sp. L21]|uniref:polyhydroxyalkanoate depolymerase n=1 Tax=Acidisphaera sp. L21 TaxID=1641851 RepID=UPI003003BEB0